jgi:hypothetical protein
VGGGAEAETGDEILLSSDAQPATAGLSTAFGWRLTSIEMTEFCWGLIWLLDEGGRSRIYFWKLLDVAAALIP